MTPSVTLEFDGPPLKRQDFRLYDGKLHMPTVKLWAKLEVLVFDGLAEGEDATSGLSLSTFPSGSTIKVTGDQSRGASSSCATQTLVLEGSMLPAQACMRARRAHTTHDWLYVADQSRQAEPAFTRQFPDAFLSLHSGWVSPKGVSPFLTHNPFF